MDEATQQLIMDVMDGNPGALTIIRRLMYFMHWELLLHHLKDQGLVGSELWRVVKDEYDQDYTRFVDDQLARLAPEQTLNQRALGRQGPFQEN